MLATPHIYKRSKVLKEYQSRGYVNENATKILSVVSKQTPDDLKKHNIWESTMPCSTVVNFPEKNEDKSIKKHLQALLGFNSIKPKSEYNRYAHDDFDFEIAEVKVSVLEEKKSDEAK